MISKEAKARIHEIKQEQREEKQKTRIEEIIENVGVVDVPIVTAGKYFSKIDLNESDVLEIIKFWESPEALLRKHVNALKIIGLFLDREALGTTEVFESLLKLPNEHFPVSIFTNMALLQRKMGDEFIGKVIRKMDNIDIFEKKFTNITTREIFEKIIADSYTSVSPTNIDYLWSMMYLREGEFSIPKDMIQKNSVNSILSSKIFPCLPRISEHLTEQDLKDILKETDNNGGLGRLLPNIHAFGDLPKHIKQELSTRVWEDRLGFFYNLDKLDTDQPLEEKLKLTFGTFDEQEKLKVISFSIENWRYNTLIKLAGIVDLEGLLPPELMEDFRERADLHFEEGNYRLAKAALKAITLIDPKRGEDLSYTEKDIPEIENQRQVLQKEYGLIDVKTQAINMYIMEGLLGELGLETYVMEHPQTKHETGIVSEKQEFSRVRDRALYLQIKNQLEQSLNKETSWALHYLIFAVGAELRYQWDHLNEPSTAVSFDVRSVPHMTREDMALFFHQAHEAFYRPGWGKYYGGKNWANIARVGINVTRTEESLESSGIYLLDRLFNLQHNTGTMLDKDWRISGAYTLYEVLDLKHETKDVPTLIEDAYSKNFITSREYRTYKKLLVQINSLKNAPRKAKGYE